MFTIISRTPEQKADLAGSWERPDESFFTAGACHIIAGVFLQTYPASDFRAWMIRPDPGFRGGHVVVSNRAMIFDARGWFSQSEFLRRYAEGCRALYPGWTFQLIEVSDVLGWEFCQTYHYRHPTLFFRDPISRAEALLDRFAAPDDMAHHGR